MANINEKCGMTDICRLCGKEEALLVPIFSMYGKEKHIANKIAICLPKLKISPSDELSKVICYKCMYILEQCSDFCTRATNANAVMNRQYSTTARPCTSSDETEMPAKKRIKPTHVNKYGKFPRQSVSLEWCSMGEDITASGGSRSSQDSLSRRTSTINIRTPIFKPSKKVQEKIMAGEEMTIYQTANNMKHVARGSSEESKAVQPKTFKTYKRNHRQLVRSTSAQGWHTNIPGNTTFDVTQKKTTEKKSLKALFESKWAEDPQYLPSPDRDIDYESDTNKSWSSARTTISDNIFGRAPRNKEPKQKDQYVPSLICMNSKQDSAVKKVPRWKQNSCSNSDSDSCGRLTPTLGPQWRRKE